LSLFFGFCCYRIGVRPVEFAQSALAAESSTVAILLVIAALAMAAFLVLPPLAIAERVGELIRRSRRVRDRRDALSGSDSASPNDYGTR
jgi:hypothetical protein